MRSTNAGELRRTASIAKLDESMPTAPPRMKSALRSIMGEGATPFIVGGCVRDALMGVKPKDIDIEVHDMDIETLQKLLSDAFERNMDVIGKSFGVFKVSEEDMDFDISLPRRDIKTGRGHTGFDVAVNPHMGFANACKRRDLTINAIGVNMYTGFVTDPHGGLDDLREGRLRAVDNKTFGEDPLRVLRVAQFAARLDMHPDEELLDLCATLDVGEVAGERQFVEIEKLLLKGNKPSIGLEVIDRCGQLHHFPELAAIKGVPQDEKWHPEGDVWTHTLMVVDEAANLRDGSASDLPLMMGALCHDYGKALATTVEDDGRVRSRGHAEAGIRPACAFLNRLKAPTTLRKQVAILVDCHLEPEMLPAQNAGHKAYRKLARKLAASGVGMDLLEKVARADQLGRTTEKALARSTPGCDEFRKIAKDAAVERTPARDVVMGRHLIELGWKPGPEFKPFLDECRDVQYETGSEDVGAIIAEAQRRGETTRTATGISR